MFCRKCGKPTPDDAQFCIYCGAQIVQMEPSMSMEKTTTASEEVVKEPQGHQESIVNSDGELSKEDHSTPVLVEAKCTNCGATIKVDPQKDAGICEFCKGAFVTEKAIRNSKSGNNTVIAEGQENNSGVQIENEMVDGTCPHCGFSGKMQIVEKCSVTGGRKLKIYVVSYGIMIVVGYFLDLILTKIFPWWLLFLGGLFVVSFVTKCVELYIRDLQITKVQCPQCKQFFEHKQL